MKKTKIITVVTVLAVAVVVAGGFASWRITRKPPVRRTTASTAASTTDSPSSLAATDNTGLGGGTEVSNNSGQTQSGAVTKSSVSSAAPASPPGPEGFSQYEQYKDAKSAMFSDLQVGTGAELTAGKKAAVIYKVWLTNGTLIDQSRLDKPGGKLQPLVFTLGDHTLIPGWEQGIFGMKVNGVRRMIIPSALAYGPQGKDGVPPNSMLIIDVQLLQVQ